MTFFLLKFFLWIAKGFGGKNTTTVFFSFVYPLHSFARETWHLFTWQRTVRNTKKTVVADGGLWGWAERAEETTSTSIAGEYCIWGRRRKVILEREKIFHGRRTQLNRTRWRREWAEKRAATFDVERVDVMKSSRAEELARLGPYAIDTLQLWARFYW